jgi:hypothetical protein
MRVQYLFNQEISDYKTLASIVSGGYDFGRAWVVNARGVTEENASSQDWRAYTSGSRAAAGLLENSEESEIVSKRSGITHVTGAQREHFQAFQEMAEASLELARHPRDIAAMERLNEANRRFRRGGEEHTERPAEEAVEAVEPVEPEAEIPKEEEATESKSAEPPKSGFREESEGAKARSFEFFTPDDPRHISYGFEIHWKDGYSPKGEYDPSDIWSVERFLFDNLEGIDYYGITGFVDGRYDNSSGTRQFGGESFTVEYMRRVFLRLETDIGSDTVRIYVPRELDISGKTFADLVNSPDVVAVSVMDGVKERFIWDMYARSQMEILAALQKQFPNMEFAQA